MPKGHKEITMVQALAVADALVKDELLTVQAAAIDAGMSANALKQARWRYRQGQASEAEAEIVEVIERAVERQCRKLLVAGQTAFEEGKKTSFVEWLLEKKAPLEYGRKQVVALTGEDGGPVKTENNNLTKLPDGDLLELYLKTCKEKGQ
jgi:hypothetical protein